MSKSYNYSPAHRIIEVLAILGGGTFWCYYFYRSLSGIWTAHQDQLWWAGVLAVLLGYLGADLVSGFVHFLADNFGNPKTPYFGPAYIRPFREHHATPKEITTHDFIELNGSNAIVCIPVMMGSYLFFSFDSLVGLIGHLTMLFFFVGIFMTNMFHKWAHDDSPPLTARKLQQWGLILTKEVHEIHHTPPFKRYYCITAGWLNPVLEKIYFFECLEWFFSGGKRKPFERVREDRIQKSQ